MDTAFVRSVVFFTIIYISSDILESRDLRRYDIHRIVFKSGNKERYKKPQHLRPFSYYKFPKENFESSHDLHGEFSNINKHILNNHPYDYRNSYRNWNRSKKNKNNSDITLKFHNHPHFITNTGNFQNFEEPGSTYDGFPQFQDVTNYYNTKQKGEYRKQIQGRQKHAIVSNSQKESDEVLSPEENNENFNKGITDINEFEVTWKPITNTKKYRSKSPKYNKKPKYNVNIGIKPNDVGYVVDLTTSKPQKLPATIIERDVYLNQNSPESVHDERQISEEVYDAPFVIDDFENSVPSKNTYSTIWNPNYSNITNSKRRRFTKPMEKPRLRSIRRPAYSHK